MGRLGEAMELIKGVREEGSHAVDLKKGKAVQGGMGSLTLNELRYR